VIATDELRSDSAARQEVLPSVEHRQHRYLNNGAENSHQSTRQCERRIGRFKSPGHAPRFLTAYGPIASYIRPQRHRLPACEYRPEMTRRSQTWREITGTIIAA
jgi:putative transposase